MSVACPLKVNHVTPTVQVVERAVGALCAKWNTNPRDPLVGVVRLLGYAHSDDRVAFREIARQLCE